MIETMNQKVNGSLLFFGEWLTPILLVILFVAAFLHWKRSRRWYLIPLGFAPLAMFVGIVAFRMTGITRIGRIGWLVDSLWLLQSSLDLLGLVCAAVGGIGAIVWALKHRTET